MPKLGTSQWSKAPGDATFALIADRLWDGLSETPTGPAAVIVDGKHISQIGLPELIPAGVQRIQLDGCTILPGLMDAHVHYCDAMGPAYLAAGVTTVRDVGNDLEWILSQRETNAGNPERGPRILCCGFLLEGPVSTNAKGPKIGWKFIGRSHEDEPGIRQSVREHAERGVDAIKLYASLEASFTEAGIDEAHRLGMTAVAHLQYTSWNDALKFGLNHFEHLANCDTAWKDATEAEDEAAIGDLLAHGAVIDPTLVVWDRLGGVLDRAFHHDSRRKWIHPGWLRIWDQYRLRFRPPAGRLSLRAGVPRLKRFLLKCHQRGVTVALGTDAPFPHLIPGFSVHDELAMYVDAGLKPVDALKAATSVNARVLGIAGRAGRISKGFDADLVVVQGNPLSRIEDIESVKLVIRNGQRLDPAELLEKTQERFTDVLDDPVTRALTDEVSRPV